MPQKWNRGPFYRRPIFMRGKLRTDILNHGYREESPDLQRSQLFFPRIDATTLSTGTLFASLYIAYFNLKPRNQGFSWGYGK
jgi:hypothetical protein